MATYMSWLVKSDGEKAGTLLWDKIFAAQSEQVAVKDYSLPCCSATKEPVARASRSSHLHDNQIMEKFDNLLYLFYLVLGCRYLYVAIKPR